MFVYNLKENCPGALRDAGESLAGSFLSLVLSQQNLPGLLWMTSVRMQQFAHAVEEIR